MKVTNLTQHLYWVRARHLLVLGILLATAFHGYSQLACHPSAEFSYSNTAFCQNDSDPIPFHVTGVNGTYSYTLVAGGPTLALDPSTGAIDLSLSFPGNYIVTNTLPGPFTCAVNLTILAKPDPEFFYDKQLYCPFGSNPILGHTTGTNGTYTYGPLAGGPFLDLNPVTGAINLSTSNFGTYVVTNAISGVCPPVFANFTLSIGDTIPPSITCPSDIFRNLDAGECEIAVDFTEAVAMDNCDPNLEITQTAGFASGSLFPIGVNTIEFAATDSLSNTSFCTFSIVVLEYPNPSQSMTCNTEVQITLDQFGTAFVGADMILEGGPYGCYDDYVVTITNDTGFVFTNWLSCNEIGRTLTAKVMDPDNGNSCWGEIILEDKTPPIILCQDWTIPCTRAVSSVEEPAYFDNCDSDPILDLAGTTQLDVNACDDNIVVFQRTWYATDKYGNTSSPCIELITVERPQIVDFPSDIVWQCNQYAVRPGIIKPNPLRSNIVDTDTTTEIIDVNPNLTSGQLSNTGSGVPSNIVGQWCKYNYSSSDEIISICNDVANVFKIVRTWSVIDWCSGEIITSGIGGEDNVQVIKVVDTTPPVISATNLTVNANIQGVHPQPCRSTGAFPTPNVTDNCSGVANVVINTQVGTIVNGHIPDPGLPIGNHIVTIQAFDNCGNVATKDIVLTVVDGIAPTPICVEFTEVNLSSTGKAEVLADAFNLASSDNCCIDHFAVRRMDDDPCDDGHNDLEFGPSVNFCCEDAGKTVTVIFRAYDCFGNFNDCMVQVIVNDKIFPVLVSCPPNQRISCDWYADNLETQLASLATATEKSQLLDPLFGTASFYDNCDININRTFSINLDQCLEGSINRSFSATDLAGNTSVQPCNQTLFIDHVSDWVVEFPADISVTCGTTIPDFGEPKIFYETCELVAITYDDELLTVSDACYKLLRTWTVINWCVVGTNPGVVDQEVLEQPENQLGLPFPQCDVDSDGDCDGRTFRDSWRSGTPSNTRRPTLLDATRNLDPDTDLDTDPWDGFITYQQVIKVTDNVDPVFTNGCAIPMVCIEDNSCDIDLSLPLPEVIDCNPNVNISAKIKIGGVWLSGFGPWQNVPPGMYEVVYTADDHCNNQTTCQTTVKIKDCKKPTPYCKTGLVTTLMNVTPPMIEVWASDLDDNSFDNCTTDLKFSFSADTSNTSVTYFCNNQNSTFFVDIWVTDECGNQDFCSTFITIQDNVDLCADPLINLGGIIATEENQGVEGVDVNLNGSSQAGFLTENSGQYSFDIPTPGGDFTVSPSKDDNPLNGVTTFDLILISKHVLGVTPLGSPYKIIAADANRSKTVTTFDIVEIRKLILHVHDVFPNNTSWRFVDKSFQFPNPANPFSEPFPEIVNVNDLDSDLPTADFVGVKIGDVNGSAVANGLVNNHVERNGSGDFVLQIEDKFVKAGDEVYVPFIANQSNAIGLQFTLDFNLQELDFNSIKEGLFTAENFGLTKQHDGAINLSWHQMDGMPKALNGELFGVKFRAKKACRLKEALAINSRFTNAEAYESLDRRLNVVLAYNFGQADCLLSNRPNPFHESTTIDFVLPQNGDCTLTLFDVNGKKLLVKTGNYSEGTNSIKVNRNELGANGVIYYRLESKDFTATNKMTVLD